MPRSSKRIFPHFRIGEELTRETAVLRGDSGGCVLRGVDGDGVGGSVGVGVVGDHLREFEFGGESGEDGGAEEAGGVADHEGRFGWGEVRRGDD